MKITVLMGGTSAERNVSLATGWGIARALGAKGHEAVAVDAAGGRLIPETDGGTGSIGREPPDSGELSKLDTGQLACRLEDLAEFAGTAAIFVALHGGAGEDGRIQAILDLMGIPYTGSGPLGSALAMDKLVSKELFRDGGIRTPAWLVGAVDAAAVEKELGGFPVVVKPSHEGSTVGISVVKRPEQLRGALAEASHFAGPPMVEQFIAGREVAVGVLGEEALPVVEIRPSHEIYDYECKYTKGMSEYEVPAPLSEECTAELQDLAVRAHRVLRLSAYSRVDFRIDESDRPWCLEANSLPGMTATSLLPKAAAAAGLGFEDLCERIVRLALERAGAVGSSTVVGG
ncbi:MAG: D-alanine--D-alanine ligase [Gemmatimonadales bacterium]